MAECSFCTECWAKGKENDALVCVMLAVIHVWR